MFCMLARSGVHADADDLNPVTFRQAPEHPPVVLVGNGQPRGRIVLMENISARIDMLAELQNVIELTTGTRLPVERGKLEGDGPAIVIGDCEAARAAGIDPDALDYEGFAIKTAPNRIYIVGSNKAAPAGLRYGVLEFMERYVGVRYYWPPQSGGRSIEANQNLVVPPVWIEDAPVFRKRENWPTFGGGGPNGELVTLHTMLRQGNSWPVNLQVHTPRWINVPEFRQTPELFQRRSDGTRNFSQICYSSPQTFDRYIKEIARVYDEGQPADANRMGISGNAISVSDPADAAISCYCDRCRKLWDTESGGYGTASRIMADFVQRLANEVKKRWPDKTIIFLPYSNYTNAPDGYSFPGNVEVQICGMPGIAQYKEPRQLKWEQDQIDGWSKISGRKIQNWHYSCWPEDRTRAPYHYPHVLKSYYQSNRDKIIGTFINGTNDHWPRQNFSLYVWFKVMWNPDFDVDAALREHCRRMYGPAAGTMHELMSLQITCWEDSRWPGGSLTPQAIYEHSFTSESLERIQALLAQAREEIGDDPLLTQRLDYYERPFAAFFSEYQQVVHGEGVQPLFVQKVGEKPVMDGKLDDKLWQQTDAVSFFRNAGDGKQVPADFPTQLRALFTSEAVIFGFRMTEPDVKALSKDIHGRDDGHMWHQDCVEVFLNFPGMNPGDCYQFIITAGGAIWDSSPHAGTTWDMEGLEVAVHTDEAEGFWSMEVYMPISSFPEVERLGTGVEWFGQFTRHRPGNGGKRVGATSGVGHENQKMNAQFGGFNSNFGDFAPIIFRE